MALPSYTLIRAKRRTLSLSVSSDAKLVVRAPMRAPVQLIEKFIYEKREWIAKIQAKVSARPQAKKKEFIPGEQFLYLGKMYPLTLSATTKKALVFNTNSFVLQESKQPKALQMFTTFYKEEARIYLEKRTTELAEKYGFTFNSIKISSALKRWGSCSAKGNLNFTWRLILAPESIVDYVICHELAHLKHHNHSQRFWNEVSSMYPRWKEARKWLRENEQLLKL